MQIIVKSEPGRSRGRDLTSGPEETYRYELIATVVDAQVKVSPLSGYRTIATRGYLTYMVYLATVFVSQALSRSWQPTKLISDLACLEIHLSCRS